MSLKVPLADRERDTLVMSVDLENDGGWCRGVDGGGGLLLAACKSPNFLLYHHMQG